MISAPAANSVAGAGRRLVAGLIDMVLSTVALVAIVFLVAFVMASVGASDQTIQSDQSNWIIIGIWVVFVWLYSALLESSPAQATLGKMALQVQVADAAGRRISFARATLRFWTKVVFNTFTIGIAFLVAAFTERHQALYDIVAGTIVIPRGAMVVAAAETPLGTADPTAVEILRARAATPTEAKSPMSGKRWDRALAALARVAEPGERPVAVANALVGPSPMVVHLLLGWLGRILLMKSALLWVTDRRVILIRLSNWTGKPKGAIFADPRSSVVLFRVESRAIWLRRLDGAEYRLNYVRKPEARWISQALGAPIV